MGGICCPPALQPPTPEHKRCRRALQGLAIGLLPVAGLAIAAADNGYIFQFFICLFLAFFLFLSWRTFQWCTVIIFLIYVLIAFIQSAIGVAGYIQYSYFFAHKYIVPSIFLVVSVIYYLIAIPVSHYVYKVFKSDSANPFVQAPQQQAGQPQEEQNQGLIQHRDEDNIRNANAGNNYFQGQGVRIG